MSKRKIYAVYDDGEKIGNYTAAEAEEELGIPQKHISAYAKTIGSTKVDITFHHKKDFKKEYRIRSHGKRAILAMDWPLTGTLQLECYWL